MDGKYIKRRRKQKTSESKAPLLRSRGEAALPLGEIDPQTGSRTANSKFTYQRH